MTAVLENLKVSADGREQHPAESVQFRHTISQFQIFRPVLPLPRCEVRPAHVKDLASASAVGLGSKFGEIPRPRVQLAVRHVHYSGKWVATLSSSGRAVSVKFHPKRGDHFGRAIGEASNWHGAFRSFDHGLSVIGGPEKSRSRLLDDKPSKSGGINARHGRSTNEADCCVVYEV